MALTADYNTCNTNSVGHITIDEGTYPFEGYHRENGGNAGWQIWVAEGTQAGYSQTLFSPVTSSVEPVVVPGNEGFRLVPEDFDPGGPDPWPGDVNGDGHTDVADLNILGINWRGEGKTMEEGDLTGDGLVNSADLNIVALNWNTWRDGPPAAAVPEPGSVTLLLLGLLAACGCVRKARS